MINVSSGKGEMLPRSLMDIYNSLRDFSSVMMKIRRKSSVFAR